jgi:hypothetical protein
MSRDVHGDGQGVPLVVLSTKQYRKPSFEAR